MAFSTDRGNRTYFDGKKWKYELNGSEIVKGELPCVRCRCYPTAKGYDACLGFLPNVKNACCGHGCDESAYIQLDNGEVFYGKDALAIIFKLKQENNQRRPLSKSVEGRPANVQRESVGATPTVGTIKRRKL